MSYLLDHIDRVVENLNNPNECSFRILFQDHQIKNLSIEFRELHKLLKQHLNKITTENKNSKAAKMLIQCYQYRLTLVINALYATNHDCIYYHLCNKQLLKPELRFHIKYLELLQHSFPKYFNHSANVPHVLFLKTRKQFLKLFNDKTISKTQHTLTLKLYQIIRNIFSEQVSEFSFNTMKYWNNFFQSFPSQVILTNDAKEKYLFKTIVKYLIVQNFNHINIYENIIDHIKDKVNDNEDFSKRLTELSKIKKDIYQIVVVNHKGFNPEGDNLKDLLLNFLIREISYYNQKYLILKTDYHHFKDSKTYNNNKIKTSLSVDQMGCFLRHMVDSGIILTQNKKETIKIIAEVFTSKNNDIVSNKSLKNKYFHNDEPSLESTKEVFLKLFKSIQR